MYDLILANDASMPAGQDWMLIQTCDVGNLLVVRRSALGDPGVMHEVVAAACGVNQAA